MATDAHVRVGEIRTFQRSNDGIDVDVEDLPDAAPDVTRLLVKADVGVGSLRVGHAVTDLDLDRGHIDFGADRRRRTREGTSPVRPDLTSLVAGASILVVGVILLLDAEGTLDLRLAGSAPLACAAIGAILLASGMTRPR